MRTKRPPKHIRHITRSRFLDPRVVFHNHWWPWNWGELSENPVIPSWLVLALPNKPWDWLSLRYLPCAPALRELITKHTGLYPMNPFSGVGCLIRNQRHYTCRDWYGIRIANEIYHRVILPKRHARWSQVVEKILNKNTAFGSHDCRVNRRVLGFITG